MKLNYNNVHSVLRDCLYKDDEDPSGGEIIDVIITKFSFNPDRLEKHREDIRSMLSDLPDEFHIDKGGGYSFLGACVTRDGTQWGEHRDIELLLALGIASKQAKILIPRALWPMFPGGMPYFVVGLKENEYARPNT